MGKTSIDGLTVRSSRSPKKPHITKATVAPLKTKKSTPHPQRVADDVVDPTIRPTTTPKSVAEDFTDPIEGFGLIEPDEQFTDADVDTDDWSELLNEFGDKQPTSSKTQSESVDLFAEEAPVEPSRKIKPNKEPKKSPKRSKYRPKKKHKVRRAIITSIFLLLVAAGVVMFVWGDSIISRLTNGKSGLWDIIGSFISETVPFETDEYGRTNILVFGTEGYNMNGDVGEGQHAGAELTDSIMVVSFDQETKDVALLSIPRDLKVAQACFAGKINEVFTCSNPDGDDEEAGAEALKSQLGEILGIDFQYWAHVNWGSLAQIVDALDGITVTLDEDIADYYNTGVVISAGVPTTIYGEQAIGLARARYGTQGGDFTRGNSQQKIVEGIIQKMVDNGIGFTDALNLFNILGDNLRTNFSSDNIKAGISFISGFDPTSIRHVPLVDQENGIYYVKSANIGGISFVIPSTGVGVYREIQAYVDKMFSNNPAVREDATVAIYNATETSGLAGAERDHLENDGYTVSEIGDTVTEDCLEKYCIYIMDESTVATKAALEARYGVTARSSAELPSDIYPDNTDIIIVIGSAES